MHRFNPSRRSRFMAAASTFAVMISLKQDEIEADRASRRV